MIYAISLGVAARLVDGVDFPGAPPTMLQVATVAMLFGTLNAVIKPMLQLMACLLYVATLGLIHFVVNAAILMLTGWIASGWLVVDGFWPALKASVIISITSTVLVWLLDPDQPTSSGPPPALRGRPGGGDIIDANYERVPPPGLRGDD